MKAKKLGRLELLGWLNDVCETDYPRIEQCSDGIGYCQIIDSLHPGSIPLNKLNFNAKYEEDFRRNLKLLDDSLKKLGLKKIVPVSKLSKSRFQDNMEFMQWLYSYATQENPVVGKYYTGYERRLEGYYKQNMNRLNPENPMINMNSHLIPNKTTFRTQRDKEDRISQDETTSLLFNPYLKGGEGAQLPGGRAQSPGAQGRAQSPGAQGRAQSPGAQGRAQSPPLGGQGGIASGVLTTVASKHITTAAQKQGGGGLSGVFGLDDDHLNSKRREQLHDLILSLENELTEQLNNHKFFIEDISKIESERDFYFGVLREIEEITMQYPDTVEKENILTILNQTPDDFMPNNNNSNSQA